MLFEICWVERMFACDDMPATHSSHAIQHFILSWDFSNGLKEKSAPWSHPPLPPSTRWSPRWPSPSTCGSPAPCGSQPWWKTGTPAPRSPSGSAPTRREGSLAPSSPSRIILFDFSTAAKFYLMSANFFFRVWLQRQQPDGGETVCAHCSAFLPVFIWDRSASQAHSPHRVPLACVGNQFLNFTPTEIQFALRSILPVSPLGSRPVCFAGPYIHLPHWNITDTILYGSFRVKKKTGQKLTPLNSWIFVSIITTSLKHIKERIWQRLKEKYWLVYKVYFTFYHNEIHFLLIFSY